MNSTHRTVPPPSSHQHRAANRHAVGAGTHWQILLGELVHLLCLFLYKSRATNEASHNDALFDQVIRHLKIVLKMQGHEDGILIRRRLCDDDTTGVPSDYLVLFGDLLLQEEARDDGTAVPGRPKGSALEKAFGYLADLGIHALYLQIPSLTAEKVDQLRLSMNIIARFNHAADEGATLGFRYKGRTIGVPVIRDSKGYPDPNLTLVAALNGLSAVNARELVKQAAAFETLQTAMDASASGDRSASTEYNQIFNVRSLRSQIIKPLVEINNVPWVHSKASSELEPWCTGRTQGIDNPQGPELPGCPDDRSLVPATLTYAARGEDPEQIRQTVSTHIAPLDEATATNFDTVFNADFSAMEPEGLAEQVVAMTRLLYSVERNCQDPRVMETILDYLRYQLAGVSEDVLSSIAAKRQGLNINIPGRSIMIGMVHPRLFDLITMVTERVDAKRRTAIIEKIAFGFDQCHLNALADGFQLSTKASLHILNLLKKCFGAKGEFIRPVFERQVKYLSAHGNAVFEILWCFLKMTPQRDDRLDFLNAIQLLMANLKDAKRALQFLLADVSQVPGSVSYTDRNAFALANILLHTENKELHVDISRTPESVLSGRRNLDQRVKHYAAWRLGIDQAQFLSKTRTIHHFLEDALKLQAEGSMGPLGVDYLLSLEREILIFCALVGGQTARIVLREALDQFGNPDSALYQFHLNTQMLSTLMTHLQIAVRAMACAGHSIDIEVLKALEKNTKALSDLDAHPMHKLNVKQVMKWVPKSLRTIQIQGPRS
jgi:hypothetical protein